MGALWCAIVLAVTVSVGVPLSAVASDVNVSGGVGIQFGTPPPPPAPVFVQVPPPFVVIPGTRISYAPSLKVDLFVFEGKYYYLHNGAWFIAKKHSGPWVYVASPPHALVGIPIAYYKVPPGHLKKLEHEREGRGKKGKD